MALFRPGSWNVFGVPLPEFGLTEKIQSTFAPQRSLTQQGGSNLFGSPGGQVVAPSPQTVVPAGGGGQPTRQTQPIALPPGGGGGGGGGGFAGESELTQLGKTDRNPIQEGRYQELLRQYQPAIAPTPEFQQIDYDAIIAPALQALDEAVAPQQSAYTANIADIEAQTGAQKRQAGQTVTEAQREAVTSRERRGQEAESAIDEARRQFSQIQQGLQARYGGATGTGRFASEIAATQTLRNISQVRQNLANAITTIDDRLSQIQEIGKIQTQDIEDRTLTLKQQAKAQLDQALNQIRIARGEIQSRKVELAQNAMQNYQQTVAQINAQNAAFKQNMALAQYQAEQQLAQARQKAQGLASQYTISSAGISQPVSGKVPLATTPVTATGETLGTAGGSLIRDKRDQEIFGG